MSDGGGALSFRRILVAVDASPASLTLLASAAKLVAGLGAELNAIFVEDINLLHLAGLPFARELVGLTATECRLDYQRMERILRGRGTHAQRAVVTVAAQLKLRGSLQVVRGRVTEELRRAAQDMDLLILGKGGGARRLGKVAGRLVEEAPCAVLLLPEQGLRAGPVMVNFSGRSCDELLLNAATRFAVLDHHGLLVILPGLSTSEYTRLHQEARRSLGSGSLLATYQALENTDQHSYRRLVREEGVGLAVLSGDENLRDWLTLLDCAVLIYRENPPAAA